MQPRPFITVSRTEERLDANIYYLFLTVILLARLLWSYSLHRGIIKSQRLHTFSWISRPNDPAFKCPRLNVPAVNLAACKRSEFNRLRLSVLIVLVIEHLDVTSWAQGRLDASIYHVFSTFCYWRMNCNLKIGVSILFTGFRVQMAKSNRRCVLTSLIVNRPAFKRSAFNRPRANVLLVLGLVIWARLLGRR